MLKNKIFLDWEVGYADNANEAPSVYYPANVPGAVQLDIASAMQYPPYQFADNYKDYGWMENKFWFYRCYFSQPELANDNVLYLVARGIDYQFTIFINKNKIWQQTGMYQPVEAKLNQHLKAENEILIQIHPVPKVADAPASRRQAAQTTKPAVSYGWDFHPRLIPLGIWDDIFLQVKKSSHLKTVDLQYQLSKSFDKVSGNIDVTGEEITGLQLNWQIIDAEGKIQEEDYLIASEDDVTLHFNLINPQLWWPHDLGEPYLYTLVISLSTFQKEKIDKITRKVGFKQVRLKMNDGAWQEPKDFPKSRSAAPATIEINGKKVFAKGTNWVNPDIFYGRVGRTTYHNLLYKAKEANFNIIRVWGGGPVNKESFYDLCDELGLMVWQDFPLACNDYVAQPEYMETLKKEARAIIFKLQKHVSLTLWCGGNELFNNWSGMTDQSLAIRLLNSLTFHFTPEIPFLSTSPLAGMGHGHYVFIDEESGEDVFSRMKKYRCIAYPEFGMPAPANEEVLKTIIPEENLYPPNQQSSWKTHHAFEAWSSNSWLELATIKNYFPKNINGLSELVYYGQLLQSEGLKCIYEEARRQKPYCSMALHWCFNEPWPTAANNSIISWPDIPKPGFEAAKKACRPVLASASFPKFCWYNNEVMTIDLWLLNDSYNKLDEGTIYLYLKHPLEKHLLQWNYNSIDANRNQQGPSARLDLKYIQPGILSIQVICKNNPQWNSEYQLVLKKAEKQVAGDQLNR